MKKIWELHAHHFLRNVKTVKHKLARQVLKFNIRSLSSPSIALLCIIASVYFFNLRPKWPVHGQHGTPGQAVVKRVVEVLSYEVER